MVLRSKCSRALVGTRRRRGARGALTPADAPVAEGAESVAEGGGDTVRKGEARKKTRDRKKKATGKQQKDI